MALTGITLGDFFVNYRQGNHNKRILNDNDTWSELKLSFDKLDFKFQLPAFCMKCLSKINMTMHIFVILHVFIFF